jgi:hypothetical protein
VKNGKKSSKKKYAPKSMPIKSKKDGRGSSSASASQSINNIKAVSSITANKNKKRGRYGPKPADIFTPSSIAPVTAPSAEILSR